MYSFNMKAEQMNALLAHSKAFGAQTTLDFTIQNGGVVTAMLDPAHSGYMSIGIELPDMVVDKKMNLSFDYSVINGAFSMFKGDVNISVDFPMVTITDGRKSKTIRSDAWDDMTAPPNLLKKAQYDLSAQINVSDLVEAESLMDDVMSAIKLTIENNTIAFESRNEKMESAKMVVEEADIYGTGTKATSKVGNLYLSDLVKAIKKSKRVEICLGDNYPVLFRVHEDGVITNILLAPVIEEDEYNW